MRKLKLISLLIEDWIFLALLGILMALCSLAIDYAIDRFQTREPSLATDHPFVVS